MTRPAPIPRFATLLLLGALGFAIFAAWMHLAVLDPRNVGWLLDGEDRGQSAIGLAAYLRAGHWPSLHQPLLAAPEGMTLLFTDSIPLLGLLLGPVAALLPGPLQFIGPWYLACVLLQVAFAWALVRRHAPDEASAFLATALLAFSPVLFNRYGHASLCAQWLILWALWIYTDADRSRRPWHWAAVLGVAALVHSYLLLMVAAIWSSAVLRALVRGDARGRTLVGAAAVALLVLGIAGWHGVLGGGYASTGTYGFYPTALDAWWNPGNPGYSALLPGSALDAGQGFEGLQYLGAGLLGLVALAIVGWLRGRRGAGEGLVWLIPAFLLLAPIAIGPKPVWQGHALFAMTLPRSLVDALDPVRAAGRLGWPITYALAYAAIVAALRQRRALVLLGVALAVQMVDLAPMLAAVRATSARAEDRTVFRRTPDPRWAALIASASSIEFEPPEAFRDLALMEEVSWRAVAACRPVRYFYASREKRATRARIEADSIAYQLAQIDPTRLYVLLGDPVPIGLVGRTERIDGVTVVAPSAPVAAPSCSSSPRSAS